MSADVIAKVDFDARGFHTWIGTDGEYSSCLTCGVLAEDSNPESIVSEMVGYAGEPIVGCTYDTSMCHHYSGECPRFDEPCRRNPECNCLSCN